MEPRFIHRRIKRNSNGFYLPVMNLLRTEFDYSKSGACRLSKYVH